MFFSPEDTIIAISTPLGRSALGVIRLSGRQSIAITDKLFSPIGKKILLNTPPNTLLHGWIKDSQKVIDEVMVVFLKEPHSYTGENMIEISAHGGPVVLNQIVKLFINNGVRLAKPGEFTLRAFINGRMDLSRAEAVADLISSKTELSAQSALTHLQGNLFNKINNWRRKIVDLLACLEVAMDYGEEDINFITKDDIISSLKFLIDEIEKLKDTAEKGKYLREGLKVAIIGRPNTGKSSLLNALLERERSIVTEIPGTTRDIIEESIDFQGVPVVIMDTAGLRKHTLDPVEKIGHERTLDSINRADIILFILNANEPLSEEDFHIAKFLDLNKKIIIVLNKIDLPKKIEESDLNKLVTGKNSVVKISALKKEGLKEMEKVILSNIDIMDNLPSESIIINLRHHEILDKAHKAIKETLDAVNLNQKEEIAAFHLRETLDFLGEITGETATEEILNNIFSRFCVGK